MLQNSWQIGMYSCTSSRIQQSGMFAGCDHLSVEKLKKADGFLISTYTVHAWLFVHCSAYLCSYLSGSFCSDIDSNLYTIMPALNSIFN
ncbi:hypothetical protein T4A_1471 [Trichinella pseudospiralis]|uniref:Uncharacterized protein n=1 Tax=Trichinella pseudospiralis TaxID=6337 RepID=A0A0V1EJT0_TRIPS|nr:hypothetical protein T4A_1471 [Trichinella pseudospiralis]